MRVMEYGSNHVNCFIRTLNGISEQQEALCYRRKCIEQRITFFNSRFFDRVPCTSVLLPEGKSRALFAHIQFHIFSYSTHYLIFKEVFLTLNNYLHFKMASR